MQKVSHLYSREEEKEEKVMNSRVDQLSLCKTENRAISSHFEVLGKGKILIIVCKSLILA